MSLTISIPTESELNSYKIIAKVASCNPYWKKVGGSGSEESVVATILSVMLLARELGISPIQAISGGINNIQGKFEISARLMNQLIRKHGHKLTIKMMTNECCIIWGSRKDTGEEMEVKYHIEEAKRSGLLKSGSAWEKVPQDMLFARCISRLARRLYPDCIGGCYVEGELQESIQGKPVDTIDVSVASELEFKEDPIILKLPEGISKENVEKFLVESAECNAVSVEHIKKRASKNMDGFLKVFKEWEQKQITVGILASMPSESEFEIAV